MNTQQFLKRRKWWYITILIPGVGFLYPLVSAHIRRRAPVSASAEEKKQIDVEQIRSEIKSVLDDPSYDDGSYAPVLIRLAWHTSGTYDHAKRTGGSNGATMRFAPESGYGANNGLLIARTLLEPIKQRHPEISYGDLWTLAGVVAVESMGGPSVSWRPGRTDQLDGKTGPPDGLLPDADKDASHIRHIFGRMGFSDQEMVALLGAHAVGRCHTDRSGYSGPWTNSPTVFSNDFFVQLRDQKWTKKDWKGPMQYADKSGNLMMLPADMALIDDANFKKWVEAYAEDEDKWHQDFGNAFCKLLELGVKFDK